VPELFDFPFSFLTFSWMDAPLDGLIVFLSSSPRGAFFLGREILS